MCTIPVQCSFSLQQTSKTKHGCFQFLWGLNATHDSIWDFLENDVCECHGLAAIKFSMHICKVNVILANRRRGRSHPISFEGSVQERTMPQ